MKKLTLIRIAYGGLGLYGLAVGVASGFALTAETCAPSIHSCAYEFFKDQGSAVAGLLAVLAAWWTIRETRRQANREIAVAQSQTRMAQRQIETTLRIEARQNAEERQGFLAMMVAAMRVTLGEITLAEGLAKQTDDGFSQLAAEARLIITRTGYQELRQACVRIGGAYSQPFLHLDREITSLAAPVTKQDYNDGFNSRTTTHAVAPSSNLSQKLTYVRGLASDLFDQASEGLKLADAAVLAAKYSQL